MFKFAQRLLATTATVLLLAGPAHALPERYSEPVKEVGGTLIDVPYAGGNAVFPIFTSAAWGEPHPELTRVVIVFHGLLRNAGVYFEGAMTARAAAGPAGQQAMVVAPQFLADLDVPAHHLPANTLGWNNDHWAGGEPALTPAPLSGFDAVDAILAHIADRRLFPNVKIVVMAGFSAGGQILQRYAVVGNGDAVLTKAGIDTRYVVSDPSSYLYFTADRPDPQPHCKSENTWKYGFAADVPPYVQGTPDSLEARYARRNVLYLVGMADTDPHHPVLDTSCAGEAQGPQRYIRAHNYFSVMQQRHPTGLNQHLIDVPGIAHEGNKMFNTACGLGALFGAPGCAELDAKR